MNLPVKKISIIAFSNERKKIIDALKSTGCFELGKIEKPEDCDVTVPSENEKLAAVNQKLAAVKKAIVFIDSCGRDCLAAYKLNKKLAAKGRRDPVEVKYKKSKKPLFSVRREISMDEFLMASASETRLTAELIRLEEAENRLSQMKSDDLKSKTLMQSYKQYLSFPLKFSAAGDTVSAFFILGVVLNKRLAALKGELDGLGVYTEEFPSSKTESVLAVIGHKENKGAAETALSAAGFMKCPFSADAACAELYAEREAAIAANYYERIKILAGCANEKELSAQLKVYYDCLIDEQENLAAQSRLIETRGTFAIGGWYPAEYEDKILSALKSATKHIYYATSVPDENDVPPVILKNNKFVSPFESVTNMFSAPGPREKDPNPVMSVFFVIFFGLMVGDAGYGIVLFLITFLALKFMKMEKGMRSLVSVICAGSVSAVVWGALFGGWFGLTKGDGTSIIPGLLDPLNDSLIFLAICLGLGVIQLVTGLILKMRILIKSGQKADAVLDIVPVLLIFIGGVMLALTIARGMFEDIFGLDAAAAISKVLQTGGLIILLIGVAGILVFYGRKNKKILKRVTGGFGGLYGLINYISDILSYSRLFGIALAGGVIASVANQLGAMIMYAMPALSFLLYPIGILVALVFHVFNVALGILSAYVHNSRLQFVEFYGKFYDGGGRIFTPMGSGTKYVVIKERY